MKKHLKPTAEFFYMKMSMEMQKSNIINSNFGAKKAKLNILSAAVFCCCCSETPKTVKTETVTIYCINQKK